MTLAVSLRVPDSLVIAADSLSTTVGQVELSAQFRGSCPECREDIELKDIQMPPIPMPSSVSSFAQKVFPFKEWYGIAAYGLAILNERTIYYHVKTLEQKYKDKEFSGVSEVAKVIRSYFDKEIKKQIKDISSAPDDFYPLGFLVAGYEGTVGKTYLINIGKKTKRTEYTGSGCTIGGDTIVVTKLWELSKSDPRRGTKYASFSLQDAVEYAEYLIHSTANFQKFANMIPSVGGEVDVALLTSFRGFTWIKCKALTMTLEGEYQRGGSKNE